MESITQRYVRLVLKRAKYGDCTCIPCTLITSIAHNGDGTQKLQCRRLVNLLCPKGSLFSSSTGTYIFGIKNNSRHPFFALQTVTKPINSYIVEFWQVSPASKVIKEFLTRGEKKNPNSNTINTAYSTYFHLDFWKIALRRHSSRKYEK